MYIKKYTKFAIKNEKITHDRSDFTVSCHIAG